MKCTHAAQQKMVSFVLFGWFGDPNKQLLIIQSLYTAALFMQMPKHKIKQTQCFDRENRHECVPYIVAARFEVQENAHKNKTKAVNRTMFCNTKGTFHHPFASAEKRFFR